MNKKKRLIDNVTTTNLDVALRMCGVQLDSSLIDIIIDLVEIIETKGDNVNIKDIVLLKQEWHQTNLNHLSKPR